MQARGNLPILDFTGEPERTFFIKFRSVLFTSKVRTSTLTLYFESRLRLWYDGHIPIGK